MRRTVRTIVLTTVLLVAVVVLGAVGYIYSGRYDVAATTPHGGVGRWVLNTVQKNSVELRSTDVSDPPPLSAQQLRHGIEYYDSMCVVCHGAPGIERGDYGKGITPTPPDLAEAARHWDDRELFWIVKHGIKLAGMPAFGPTHTDEELWSLVAVVKRLPQTSAAEYRSMTAQIRQASAGRDADGHSHGAGSEESEHSHEPTSGQDGSAAGASDPPPAP